MTDNTIQMIIAVVAVFALLCAIAWAILKGLSALLSFLFSRRGVGLALVCVASWRVYAAYSSASSPSPASYAVIAILLLVGLPLLLTRRRRIVTAEQDEPTASRPPVLARFRKTPKVSAEDYLNICKTQAKITTAAQEAALVDTIKKYMAKRLHSEWENTTGELYFSPATTRQLDFLKSLGYKGKKPRYCGECSTLIDAMRMLQEYNRAEPPGKSQPAKPAETALDFTALWNCATQAGYLSRRDAEKLLETVMKAKDTPERAALVAALSAVISAPADNAEVPPDLHSIASAWIGV